MDNDFWHERWARNEIGFHRDDFNPFLLQYWAALQTSPNGSIFVPLCGKSVDLIWLSKQCASVVGVELSQKAIENFFSESGLSPELTQTEYFSIYSSGNIRVFCGDFFKLKPNDLARCSIIYDRASLIALPADVRQQYASKLDELFTQPHKRLLITLDYDQSLMNGPPFAVSPDEVSLLFTGKHQVTCLESLSIIEQNKRFKDKGLSELDEHIFLLEKR